MHRFSRQTFVFCLAAALVIMPVMSGYASAADSAATVEEEGPSAGAMVGDLVGVRPIGIVTTTLGLVGYVISLPFSLPGGNSGDVWEKCVKEPAKYTFVRPLGEF